MLLKPTPSTHLHEQSRRSPKQGRETSPIRLLSLRCQPARCTKTLTVDVKLFRFRNGKVDELPDALAVIPDERLEHCISVLFGNLAMRFI